MRGRLTAAAPPATKIWPALFRRGCGGLLVCQWPLSENRGGGTGLAGRRGAQTGTLRSLPRDPGSDAGTKADARRGAGRTSNRDLGPPLSAVYRHLSRASASRARAGTVGPTSAGRTAVADRAQRAKLALGGGRGFGGLRRRRHSGLGTLALENRKQRLWRTDATLAPYPLCPSPPGGSAGTAVDQNHRLHTFSR